MYDAVVVGAGISGLTTAQALVSKHGLSNFLVTEGRERVGGNITSMQGNGYVWEEGPNSFQPNDFMLQIAVRRRMQSKGTSNVLSTHGCTCLCRHTWFHASTHTCMDARMACPPKSKQMHTY